VPEHGIDLLGHDPGPFAWEVAVGPVALLRLRASHAEAVDVLREAYAQTGGERVEAACGGGVGQDGRRAGRGRRHDGSV
jgi:hypothetical protein